MDFRLDDGDKAFLKEFASLVDLRILPRSEEVDRAGEFPRESWRALAEAGFFGLFFDERSGGTGAGAVLRVLAQAELARGCASTALAAGASSGIFGGPLSAFGSEELCSLILPGFARGEMVGAFALGEPDSADPWALRTTARRTGSGFVLDGRKAFVTNGADADWVLLLARTGPGEGGDGLSAFVVRKGTPGMVVGPALRTLGVRGAPGCGLVLSGCEIPAQWQVGELGAGQAVARVALERGSLGLAAFSVGIAQAALDEAVRHAGRIGALGRGVDRCQPISFRLADMRIDLDGARLLLLRAARAQEGGGTGASLVAAARLFSTEAAVRCTDRAMQVCGGQGYMAGHRVERLYRDARLGPIAEGGSEALRRRIAKETLAALG